MHAAEERSAGFRGTGQLRRGVRFHGVGHKLHIAGRLGLQEAALGPEGAARREMAFDDVRGVQLCLQFREGHCRVDCLQGCVAFPFEDDW